MAGARSVFDRAPLAVIKAAMRAGAAIDQSMASSMSPVIFFSHAVEDAEQYFRADLVGWI